MLLQHEKLRAVGLSLPLRRIIMLRGRNSLSTVCAKNVFGCGSAAVRNMRIAP